jgi:hypothetical protein
MVVYTVKKKATHTAHLPNAGSLESFRHDRGLKRNVRHQSPVTIIGPGISNIQYIQYMQRRRAFCLAKSQDISRLAMPVQVASGAVCLWDLKKKTRVRQ